MIDLKLNLESSSLIIHVLKSKKRYGKTILFIVAIGTARMLLSLLYFDLNLSSSKEKETAKNETKSPYHIKAKADKMDNTKMIKNSLFFLFLCVFTRVITLRKMANNPTFKPKDSL